MKGGDNYGLSSAASHGAALARAAARLQAAAWCVATSQDRVSVLMLCKNPFVPSAGPAYGCGQCTPCRLNRRRIWTHRLMLEAAQYDANAFVTLTYSDEHIPSDGSLDPSHLRLWLKRLRRAVEPSRFRFYAVGEYGDESQRAHYHAALFGFRPCAYGRSRYSARTVDCCYWCDLVRDTWGKGNIFSGVLERDSAQYLCGYVVKKMTAKDDPRLVGRHPEFARMSLRPGIGHDAMHEMASVLMQYGLEYDAGGDVPLSLSHGGRKMPLGRYLRSTLRKMVGGDGKISQSAFTALETELLALRLSARGDTENPSVKKRIAERDLGRLRSVEARGKLFKQRRTI